MRCITIVYMENLTKKTLHEWIYGNEDFCINTNEKILQIIDKVGVNE